MTSPFVINSINMFSSWTFNLPKNHECTICRCSLNGPSLYNQDKGMDSYVVSGVCQHSFHYECIKPWVDKNKYCPLCSQVWQYQQPTSKINIIGELPPNKKAKNMLNNIANVDIYKYDSLNQIPQVENNAEQNQDPSYFTMVPNQIGGFGNSMNVYSFALPK